ncbi:MAG: ABC transporter substrate-binding protein [Anaerolineales bacterium]|nr:ABC transporter substrate-binding protein [Anaerolineales bacterium]
MLKDAIAATGESVETIAKLWVNDLFGITARDAVIDLWNKDPDLGGYTVVADIPHAPSPSDLTAEVLQLKAANADVLFVTQHEPGATLLQKALKEYDVNFKLILATDAGQTTEYFQNAVREDAAYIASRSSWNWDIEKEISKQVDQAYYDLWGLHMTGINARHWVGAYTVHKVFELAGSTDPEVLRQTLVDLYIDPAELITPWGVQFYPPGHPERGQNKLASGVIIQYMLDPESEYGVTTYTVWPFDAASRDAVFPIPTWAER